MIISKPQWFKKGVSFSPVKPNLEIDSSGMIQLPKEVRRGGRSLLAYCPAPCSVWLSKSWVKEAVELQAAGPHSSQKGGRAKYEKCVPAGFISFH